MSSVEEARDDNEVCINVAAIFANEVEGAAHNIINYHISLEGLTGVEFNPNVIIRYIPTIMDMAERNISKKKLINMHRRNSSREDIKLLLDHTKSFGKHKEKFVTSVVAKIAEMTNTDITNVRPHLKAIIDSIHAAPRVFKQKKDRSACCLGW